MRQIFLIILFLLSVFVRSFEVKVVTAADGVQLQRDGKPYFIKGAGGSDHLDILAQNGGNSIRTWSTTNLGPLLDDCQKRGLTVCAGIWLAPERSGFNYADPARVEKQLEKAKAEVLKYKDHPALLMWGVGNEIEDHGQKEEIWKAMDAVAKMIHETDPNHPALCVFAEFSKEKLAALNKHCPNIDILGINCYGGAHNIGQRVKDSGWKKAFIVTEFGPLGFWEVGKAKWGAPVEETSNTKADRYHENYQRSIAKNSQCVGSYAFIWGHKQERTATWFGTFLKSGESLNAVDTLCQAWTGKLPANQSPSIEKFDCSAHKQELEPGATIECSITAKDPDGDALTVRWELCDESRDNKTGGDKESIPAAHPDALVEAKDLRATFKAPQTPGAYRLFAYVLDGKGHAATANAVFFVKKK